MSDYVSDQLTHFAGASLGDDAARYSLLATILRSGTLLDGRYLNAKRRPIFYFAIKDADGTSTRVDYFPEPYFELDRSASVAFDEWVRPEMVCFCDIPLKPDYLEIHTSKYGRFGVAFNRSFAVAHGASPVTYIANAAKTTARALSGGEYASIFTKAEGQSLFTTSARRDEYIGQLRERHYQLVIERKEAAEAAAERYKRGEIDVNTMYKLVVESLDYAVASWAYLFGLHKRFDSALPQNHPDNYYMEREWRVLGTVTFQLDDVAVVIVPKEFASRVQADFPALAGKVLEL